MTLDDEQIPWLEASRQQDEWYQEQAHQEWLVQRECESPEAMESFFAGRFRQSGEHWTGEQSWDGTS